MKATVSLLLLGLLLTGCSTLVTTPGTPQRAPVTVAPPPAPAPTPEPAPAVVAPPVVEKAPVAPPPPLPAPEPVAPVQPSATAGLLAAVDAALQAGDLVQASAVCERALRITPRDAMLWYRLAEIRQRQQRWQDAVANARRGLLFVGGNAALQAQLNQLLREVEPRASVP
jgi:hypothetical protein